MDPLIIMHAGVASGTVLLFATLGAWLLLGEPLVALQFAGGAVVLAGIYLARRGSA